MSSFYDSPLKLPGKLVTSVPFCFPIKTIIVWSINVALVPLYILCCVTITIQKITNNQNRVHECPITIPMKYDQCFKQFMLIRRFVLECYVYTSPVQLYTQGCTAIQPYNNCDYLTGPRVVRRRSGRAITGVTTLSYTVIC
jgi:hypothetical protein